MKLKLQDMTVEQKLGMTFCARKFAPEDVDFIIELIKKRALGCVQLNAGNTEVNEKILAAADYPLLVFNDTEQGFPTTKLPKVPLISLAACGKKEYYQAFARAIATEAKAAGFNGTWGPVVDILECDGPCKISRVFSDEADEVTEAAAYIAEVYKQNRYLSTGKHYPGSTGIPFDTHMTEGVSELSREDIISKNLKPYKDLMAKGLLPCIMTSHSVYKNIDPDYPASLSKKCINIIREMGFDGVAFTDSFAMMGVLQRFGEENIYGMAVAAGNDIILPNYRTPVKEAFGMLVKNFNDGAIPMERLDEAARRVLTAMDFVAEQPEDPVVFTEQDAELVNNVARDCITAVTDDGLSAGVGEDTADRMFIIVTPNDFKEDSIEQEISFGKSYNPNYLAAKIRKEFPNAEVDFVPEFSYARDHDRLLFKGTKYKEIVFVTFCETTSYLGTDGLTRRTEALINAFAHSGKVSAIVHFGNPFALKYLEHIPRKIFGYNIRKSQEFAIDVLAGKLEAKGKLPFKVELN